NGTAGDCDRQGADTAARPGTGEGDAPGIRGRRLRYGGCPRGAGRPGSVPAVGLPEVPGAAGAAVAVLHVVQAPLDLGLGVGLPVGARRGHLAAGQGLDQAVGAAGGVRGADVPVALVLDDPGEALVLGRVADHLLRGRLCRGGLRRGGLGGRGDDQRAAGRGGQGGTGGGLLRGGDGAEQGSGGHGRPFGRGRGGAGRGGQGGAGDGLLRGGGGAGQGSGGHGRPFGRERWVAAVCGSRGPSAGRTAAPRPRGARRRLATSSRETGRTDVRKDRFY